MMVVLEATLGSGLFKFFAFPENLGRAWTEPRIF